MCPKIGLEMLVEFSFLLKSSPPQNLYGVLCCALPSSGSSTANTEFEFEVFKKKVTGHGCLGGHLFSKRLYY